MRIVIVSEWFSESMGYSDNCLPKALAALGHEVHLVTTNTQPYFSASFYEHTYEPFIGPGVVEPGTKSFDGYLLHRLPYRTLRGRIGHRGLLRLLASLRPEIVQVTSHTSLGAWEVAIAEPWLRYQMFTANHVLASVFPPAAARGAHPLWWKFKIRLFTTLPGRLVSSVTRLCYAATTDARDVAISYFGVPPEKVVVSPLGSDTELFGRVANKSTDEIRQQVRQELGIKDDVVVFIYTGRFSADKNPRLLAQAVARLNECGVNVKGLFIGAGEQQDDIANTPCCSILPFVPFKELPRYYWAAEVGVWPRQESMSMIDAAAASLPIVVSDTVKATERFEGTGLTYKLDDLDDLVGVLRILARDANLRRALGEAGAERVRERHSWFLIAKARANDYEAAVATRSRT